MRREEDQREVLERLRSEIETFVDGLIGALDTIDSASEDLEDTDDDDLVDEPSLGATEDFDQRKAWVSAAQHTPDLEEDEWIAWWPI